MFEEIAAKRLIDYLETQYLVDPCQTGFRADHATETALLSIIYDVRF